jgi:hypothetical protein
MQSLLSKSSIIKIGTGYRSNDGGFEFEVE